MPVSPGQAWQTWKQHGWQATAPLEGLISQSSQARPISWSSWTTCSWQHSGTHRHRHPQPCSPQVEVWNNPKDIRVGSTILVLMNTTTLYDSASIELEPYLHKHDHTFAQDSTDRDFVMVVALEGLFFQKLACGQVKGFTRPVEPAAIEPLLTFSHKDKVMLTI